MNEHKISPENVRTHQDVAPGQTSCPGRDFYRYLKNGRFKAWVESARRGEKLAIDPGPPLPDGPWEVITETTANKKRDESKKPEVAPKK